MPIAAPVGAAMVSGGADLMNNLFNLYSTNKTNKLNYKMFQEANKFAHDEAQLAFDRESQFAEKMFNAENEYNSPLKMLERLEQAGLSPFDYFSNGNYMGASAQNVNSSAAVPGISHAMTTPTLDINANGAINAFAQVIGAISESKYKDAQSWDLYNTATERLRSISADADYKESLKALTDLDAMIRENKLPYEIKNLMADFENKCAEKDLKSAQELLTKVETSHEWEKSKTTRDLRPYLVANARHLYDVYSSEITRNVASASESYAHAGLYGEQTEYQSFMNDIAAFQKEFEVLDYSAKIKWISDRNNFDNLVDSYRQAIDASKASDWMKYNLNKRLGDIEHDLRTGRDKNDVLRRLQDVMYDIRNNMPTPFVNGSFEMAR